MGARRRRRRRRRDEFPHHFTSITAGVIDLRDVIFFGSLMAVCLFINVLLVDTRKGA